MTLALWLTRYLMVFIASSMRLGSVMLPFCIQRDIKVAADQNFLARYADISQSALFFGESM